ncbi:M1 family metallopeptidase [Neobacillus niacini]|uniref:M1 family metallopeptidase n=1 Tax=Neobacillus niacini TaxID=86668 RepID=UPI001C8ED0FB|nr:M1 family metallopeptidase [Neobacillus niacini]MBY0146194.1 M1 family metallopeptidase [Neobacillus niacini]
MNKGDIIKRGYWLAAILILLTVLLAGCKENYSKDTDGTNKKGNKTAAIKSEEFIPTEYDSTVTVNVEEKTLTGILKVKATNNTGKSQDKIYFHVYPNQFREGVDLVGGFWRQIIDVKSEPGSMAVTEVQVNGIKGDFEIKDTVLEIPLDKWKKGEAINLQLNFTMKVPKNNGRFAYDDNTIWLGNWIPIQAVYDERGWVTDPYHSIGDPFYSQVGKYTVKVSVPDNYKIATTGKEEEAVKEQDGLLSYTTSIEDVRDFAMVIMNESYQKISDQVGETTVNTWYLASDSEEAAKQNHEAGKKSLAYFSKVYGHYPYPEYDIVRTGMFTAMEYPGLIFLPKNILESNETEIGSVVHETAHQWWYSMVGNDEVKEPWLDEALATYTTTRFMLEEYPEYGAAQLEMRKHMTEGTESFEKQDIFIGSPVDKFTNIGSYSQLVYQKGALMLENLEKEIGKEKMDELLQNFFKEYQYGVATSSDFISVFSEELGPEAKEYFESWLTGKEPEFKQ